MMSNTTRIKVYIVGLLVSVSMGALFASAPAMAQPASETGGSGGGCNSRFLTFPAWYNGVVEQRGNDCEVISPTKMPGGSKTFVWRIALNIVEIMLNAVGYLAVGFIIYGGLKYIYSAGSPDGMVSARKTIFNAVIGLVLSIASVAIVNTIAGGLSS